MMRCLWYISPCGPHDLRSKELGKYEPVKMLRRVELLDELLGLCRPRGAGDGEGLAAEDLGVVDAKFWGEDLVTQAGL